MNMLADAGTRRHHAGVNEPPRSLELLVVSERLHGPLLGRTPVAAGRHARLHGVWALCMQESKWRSALGRLLLRRKQCATLAGPRW